MTRAKVFQSGNSQAIRLPKEFRFKTKEVEIFQRGDEVVLREKVYTPGDVFALLVSLPADFMAAGRDDTLPQEREEF